MHVAMDEWSSFLILHVYMDKRKFFLKLKTHLLFL